MLAFLIKAAVATLKKFPDFNSSIDPDGAAIVRKNYWHIGFAADTPNGLVVPVIRDADRKGISRSPPRPRRWRQGARRQARPGRHAGRHLLVSSLGGIGGTYFTPIINAPRWRSSRVPLEHAAGVGRQGLRAAARPAAVAVVGPPVVDGASAARFNAHLAALLADFRRVML